MYKAKIVMKATAPMPHYYTINSFHYDTRNGEDYLILLTIDSESKEFKLSDLDTFALNPTSNTEKII